VVRRQEVVLVLKHLLLFLAGTFCGSFSSRWLSDVGASFNGRLGSWLGLWAWLGSFSRLGSVVRLVAPQLSCPPWLVLVGICHKGI
jgi:hypothetical protein